MHDSNDERESEDSLIGHEASEFIAKNWYDWFFYTPTYIMAIVFLLARLANNTLGAYLTLYVTDTIQLNTDYIAILPFVQYSMFWMNQVLKDEMTGISFMTIQTVFFNYFNRY